MSIVGKQQGIVAAESIVMDFAGLRAIDDVSLEVNKHEIVGVIGPNGAGKSTLFNIVSGVYQPSSGQIRYLGRDITRLSPHERARLGIGRTFQNIRLFKDLSVIANLHYSYLPARTLGLGLLPNRQRQEAATAGLQRCEELLEVFKLADFQQHKASSLSYGGQRRLEIARALINQPALLLLDEPAAGMNPQETDELAKLIGRINQEFGTTILLIEHNVKMVKAVCERMYVLNHGRLIGSGRPSQVFNQSEVIKAYLGT